MEVSFFFRLKLGALRLQLHGSFLRYHETPTSARFVPTLTGELGGKRERIFNPFVCSNLLLPRKFPGYCHQAPERRTWSIN